MWLKLSLRTVIFFNYQFQQIDWSKSHDTCTIPCVGTCVILVLFKTEYSILFHKSNRISISDLSFMYVWRWCQNETQLRPHFRRTSARKQNIDLLPSFFNISGHQERDGIRLDSLGGCQYVRRCVAGFHFQRVSQFERRISDFWSSIRKFQNRMSEKAHTNERIRLWHKNALATIAQLVSRECDSTSGKHGIHGKENLICTLFLLCAAVVKVVCSFNSNIASQNFSHHGTPHNLQRTLCRNTFLL